MSCDFDLICLGSGPASGTVATACAKQGLRVAVVEAREFGGTCALRGCNPKKVFTNAAGLVDQFRRANSRLARGNDIRIEWADLVEFQHQFTDPVREKTEEKLRKHGIETFHGAARFAGERTIEVEEKSIAAKAIFIGVGATPVPLNIAHEELIVTSDDFMELRELPSELLFLGGGYISFEFAHAVVRAGAKVTIVDRHELPLKSFDPDLVRLLIKASEAAGIKVLTQTEAKAIEERSGKSFVTLKTGSDEVTLSTDRVVHGGGRIPNIASLNLEAGEIAYAKHGVTVNSFLQSTTNSAVFAAGDCADIGAQMLTPVAEAAARIAAANIIASLQHRLSSSKTADPELERADYGIVPQVVFSIPPLAAAGLSEVQAREQGFDIDVRYQDLSTKGEFRKVCAAAAGCKLIIDRLTDRILGAHVLGPHAEDVINLFAIAIQFQLTTANLKAMLFTYPTMTAEYLRLL